MSCTCFIIPKDILEKLAKDPELSEELRNASARTARISTDLRNLRDQAIKLTSTMIAGNFAPTIALAAFPAVTVYDCKHHQTTPGVSVPNPSNSADLTASRTFKETTAVANFYKQVFGRNSIDGVGMTMMSSIHYGINYNNAMWNGSQMIYGDGDNQIFIDFTNGNDVIGHELTHGVTQHTLQLIYSGDAGGLNESISDCFGSMFRQWQANQDVNHADWLIGHDIMGSVAKAKGYTCLRDMANPAATHCLAPQPTKYSQITPNMDPHYSSGPPNLAFYLACKSVGGKSWEKVGQIWYLAVTGGASPNMKMKDFADRTRHVASQKYNTVPAIVAAVDKAWKQVGL
ncbi:MAG: M4 family metallopeptidase [Methylococcales bacterium]